MGDILHTLLYVPTFNILMVLYAYLGQNLGLAIIALAFITRLITYPLTRNQMNNAAKSKEFQAEYARVKKKYEKNKEKQAEELGKLQMKFLPGQLSGCLPIILQIIFLIQVRNAIVALVHEGGLSAFNKVAYPFVSDIISRANITTINLHFLGIDLAKVATDFGIGNLPEVLPYILLAVLVGATQLFSTKILTALNTPPKPKVEEKKGKKTKKTEKTANKPDMEEMMKMMNTQMTYMFPVMTILMSLGYLGGSKFLPSGVSLFWTIQSLFVIIQHVFTNKEALIKRFQLLLKKSNE